MWYCLTLCGMPPRIEVGKNIRTISVWPVPDSEWTLTPFSWQSEVVFATSKQLLHSQTCQSSPVCQRLVNQSQAGVRGSYAPLISDSERFKKVGRFVWQLPEGGGDRRGTMMRAWDWRQEQGAITDCFLCWLHGQWGSDNEPSPPKWISGSGSLWPLHTNIINPLQMLCFH